MTSPPPHAALKQDAATWFAALRDRICAEFETIEQEAGGDVRFQRTSWERPGGGGGTMSVLRGQILSLIHI